MNDTALIIASQELKPLLIANIGAIAITFVMDLVAIGTVIYAFWALSKRIAKLEARK